MPARHPHTHAPLRSSIKVATKRADEPYVHELCLAAADLEARYAAREVRRAGLGRRLEALG